MSIFAEVGPIDTKARRPALSSRSALRTRIDRSAAGAWKTGCDRPSATGTRSVPGAAICSAAALCRDPGWTRK